MPSWFFLLLFLATLAGGLLPLLARGSHRILHLLLSLASGFFLGVVFLHLLPELDHDGHAGTALWAWVLAGLLLVLVVDLGLFGKQSHAAVGWATLIGLSVHGCATGLSLGVMAIVPESLGIAMLVHKFGESFSLASALRFTVSRRGLVAGIVATFSLVAPVSMWIGSTARGALPDQFAPVISAIAAGSFLYVAVGDLLPEVFHEPEDRGTKLVLLLAGVAFAALAQSDGHGHGHAHGPEAESILAAWLDHALHIFGEAAPFLLLGFVAAALVRAFTPGRWLSRLLGRDNLGSVVRASLVGAPLPLCSCSVLPTAVSLHRRGASKPATVSFLVSTPETGIDSISVTWALMDPFLTVVRPIGAILSAIVAGLMTRVFDRRPLQPPADAGEAAGEDEHLLHDEAEPLGARLRESLRFAFVDILDDIMPAMLVGLGLAALLAVFLPAGALAGPWTQGPLGLLLAAVVGVPIFVCASASTPIAVALILKGLSPGAALVFLLVGPATNLGSLLVLRRVFGARTVWVYLASILACALLCGAAVDAWYAWRGEPIQVRGGGEHPEAMGALAIVSSVALGALSAMALWRRYRTLAAADHVTPHAH